MIKAFAFQGFTQQMGYSPCFTLPSLGARNAGYVERSLGLGKFVFWCEFQNLFGVL